MSSTDKLFLRLALFFYPSIISYVFCFFTYKIVFSLFILRNL